MTNLKNTYFLLLIDIRRSTELPPKAINEKMKLLEATLMQLNTEFSKDIALPLSISYGDEIAGLFHSPRNLYNIIKIIQNTFYPLTTIRFAAVKGKISTESEDIRKIGGMIFKKASTAIALLKANDNYASWQLGNIVLDKSLDSLCEISNVLINDMSEYQRKVFNLLNTGLTQKEIANQLSKYPQSVWDAIQRSKAIYIINAQKTVNLILAAKN